jgi:hypothetical protein
MRKTLLASLAGGLALTGLVIASCTDTPIGPGETAYLAGLRGAEGFSGADVLQSVSGNAHLIDDTSSRTVTFQMRKLADGSVDGWYNASVRGPGGADVRVRVDCLHVVGNQAWAGGTIVAAVDPDNVGRSVSMRFIDNGEGASALPDEFGGIWEYHDCASEPDLLTRQLTIGNLQVRG